MVCRLVVLALVCLFPLNDLAWSYTGDGQAGSSLAVPTQMTDAAFRERFAAGEFLLSIDGVRHFIERQVKAEKEIFKAAWKSRRIELGDISDGRIRGRVKGSVAGLGPVVFIKVAGLLSSTLQPACVDLAGRIGTSAEFDGLPVIYIDSTLCNTPDRCIQRHETDEVVQWEDLRVNVLHIADKKGMGSWIRQHIDTADDALRGTPYQNMNCRQIAKLFHGSSYPLRKFYKDLLDSTDLDYGYLRTMLALYGYDENSAGINIAAGNAGAEAALFAAGLEPIRPDTQPAIIYRRLKWSDVPFGAEVTAVWGDNVNGDSLTRFYGYLAGGAMNLKPNAVDLYFSLLLLNITISTLGISSKKLRDSLLELFIHRRRQEPNPGEEGRIAYQAYTAWQDSEFRGRDLPREIITLLNTIRASCGGLQGAEVVFSIIETNMGLVESVGGNLARHAETVPDAGPAETPGTGNDDEEESARLTLRRLTEEYKALPDEDAVARVERVAANVASVAAGGRKIAFFSMKAAVLELENNVRAAIQSRMGKEGNTMGFLNRIAGIYSTVTMTKQVARVYLEEYPVYENLAATADIKCRAGKYEEALSIVEHCLKRIPKVRELLVAGSQYSPRMLQDLEQDRLRVLLVKARANLGLGKTSEGVLAAYEAANTLREKIDKTLARETDLCVQYRGALVALVTGYVEAASFTKARVYLDELMSLLFKANISHDNRGELFISLLLTADAYMRGKATFRDIDAIRVAEQCIEEAERLIPGTNQARILRAMAISEKGDMEEAAKELDRISSLAGVDDRSLSVYIRLSIAVALSLYNSGREEEARQIRARVERQMPGVLHDAIVNRIIINGFLAITRGYDAALQDIGGIVDECKRVKEYVLAAMMQRVTMSIGKALRDDGRVELREASGRLHDYAQLCLDVFGDNAFSKEVVDTESRVAPPRFKESFISIAQMLLEQDTSIVPYRTKFNILKYLAYIRKRGESPAAIVEQLERLFSSVPQPANGTAGQEANVKADKKNDRAYAALKEEIRAHIDELVKQCTLAEKLRRVAGTFEGGQYKKALAETDLALEAPAEAEDADTRDRLNVYKEASSYALKGGASYDEQHFSLAALQYEKASEMIKMANAVPGEALNHKYARARRMAEAEEAYGSGDFDRALQIAGEVGDKASRDFTARVNKVRKAEQGSRTDITPIVKLMRQYPFDERVKRALAEHRAGQRAYRQKCATFDDMALDVRNMLSLADIAKEDFVRILDNLRKMHALIRYNRDLGAFLREAAELAYDRGIYTLSLQIARFGMAVVPEDARSVKNVLMILARKAGAQLVAAKLQRHFDILDCHFQADNLRERKKMDERGTVDYDFSVLKKNPDGATLEISGLTYKSVNGLPKEIKDVRTAVTRGESYVLVVENGGGKTAQFVLKAVAIEEGKAVFKPEDGASTSSVFLDIPEKKGVLKKLRDPSLKERRDVVFGNLSELNFSLVGGENPSTGNPFADVLLGLQPPRGNAVSDDHVEFGDERIAKDPTQRRAVAASLDPTVPLALIQGPPGTGKTSVIVEMVRQFRSRGRKVLVVSQSNPAVDNVAKRLLEIQRDGEDIPFARVGNNKKAVDPEVCVSDAYNNKRSVLEAMRTQDRGCVVLGTIGGLSSDHDMRKMEAYYGQFDVVIIEEAGRATLAETLVPLSRARPAGKVILVGDHNQLPPYGIDETQIEETKEELAKNSYKKDRLDGIFSASKVREFKTSPFERCWEFGKGFRDGVHKHFLAVNRRSHPVLARLVSDLFYGGRMEIDPEQSAVPEEDTFRLIDYAEDKPLTARDSLYAPVHEQKIGTSYGNVREVNIALNEFDRLLNQRRDGSYRYGVKDITIITPFAPQRALLKQAFAVKAIMNRLRRGDSPGQAALTTEDEKSLTVALKPGSGKAGAAIRALAQGGQDAASKEILVRTVADALIFDVGSRHGERSVMPEDIEALGLFDVETVDSIQGSENKAVILSLVRSNTIGQIGFMGTADGLQRLTVAFSRAQEKFTVIGDFTGTLTQARYTPLRPDPRSVFQRERRMMTGKAQIAFKKALEYYKTLQTSFAAPAAAEGAAPAENRKGSPAAFLETVRDSKLQEAMSAGGFAFRDIVPLRRFSPGTVYKEIRILISLGILERADIDGRARIRFSPAIRALGVSHAALLIDAMNGIEYRIGLKHNPLQRYDIPDEKDMMLVRGLVDNALSIETARHLPEILPPATTGEGRFYVMRYNDTKMKEYASRTGVGADTFRALIEAYVKLLQVRLGGAKRVRLIPSENTRQPFISFACYNSLSRTPKTLIGEGHIDVDDAAVDKDSTLRIIEMANMAFAVSNIPLKPREGELDQYARLIAFVQDRYSELTGKKISLQEMLKDGRVITLPSVRPIPPEKLREYYEVTVRQLAQAA